MMKTAQAGVFKMLDFDVTIVYHVFSGRDSHFSGKILGSRERQIP